MRQLYRFFAEDRQSAAEWRACDATVGQRARMVEEAHAAANARGKAGKTQAEMGIHVRKEGGGGAYEPLRKVWAILRPTWGGMLRGELEAVGMLLVAALRMVELNLQTDLVRQLERTLSTRHLADFKLALAKGAAVQLGGAALRLAYSFLQSRLTWKWRKKLTKHLHDLYFDGMNFYWVGAGAGNSASRLHDPDSRITTDVSATVDGFAACFSDNLFALMTGVLYTRELWAIYGWRTAIAPYAYLGLSYTVVEIVVPMRDYYRKLNHAAQVSYGWHNLTTQRLQSQYEAIAAQKGGEREGIGMFEEWLVHVRDCQNRVWGRAKWNMLVKFFLDMGANQFVAIFCIGGALRGGGSASAAAGAPDTIDKMADTRAEVGVKFMLFQQTMSAVRTGIDSVQNMQQLLGQVERVTEMIEILKRLSAKKRVQSQANFLAGERIGFERVTVVTPGKIKLVTELSFEVQSGGDSLLLVGHNGSGKSSIFRCLAGLWAVPTGHVTKPADFTDAVFYIPQRACKSCHTLHAVRCSVSAPRSCAVSSRTTAVSLMR